MFAIPLLAITIVAATIVTLSFSVSVTTAQSIFIDGELDQELSCNAGNTCVGDAITITNNANVDARLKLSSSECEDSTISYIGIMHFTQKDLVNWTPIDGGKVADIEYTIAGEDFIANGIPEGYKLIYYPDMEDGFAENVENILVYGEDVFPSLPVAEDIGDDYCNNGKNPNAKVCRGAKLWLIPEEYVEELKSGNWNNASEFLFETDLVTYTKGTYGNILIPANSVITFYPTITSNILAGNSTCDIVVNVVNADTA